MIPAGRRWLHRLRADESGSVVTSVAGVAIFLAFLLLAAQVTLHLYATSTATAVAFDAARRVAADGAYACADAVRDTRTRLGGYHGVTVTCDDTSDPQVVVVEVAGPSPARLVSWFGDAAGIATLHRAVRLRVEDLVGAAP